MIDSIEDNLSFHPEELTLGQVGDDLFLDIRHRIMTAHFGPGSWLSVPGLAASRSMDDALALAVCRALQRHV